MTLNNLWKVFHFGKREVAIFRVQEPNGEHEFTATTLITKNRVISTSALTIEEALFNLGEGLGRLTVARDIATAGEKP